MMEAGGGRIINFSSNAGRTSSPALGCHYTAAKAGVLGLTRHLAKEYASHKILVNTVAPGPARVERNFEIRRGVAGAASRRACLGRPAGLTSLGGALPRLGGRRVHHRRHHRREWWLRDGVSGDADLHGAVQLHRAGHLPSTAAGRSTIEEAPGELGGVSRRST
jgi:NAD(P)-dependent dehydrogenase (short-subunit alcohol dehydrogenase family)